MTKVLLAILFFTLSTTCSAATFYLSSLGVTYHGYGVNDEIAQQMPHRITDDGKWVRHPVDVSVNFITDSGLHLNITYLKDCFDEPALLLALGRHWQITPRFGVGYIGGVYTRQVHHFIDKNDRRSTVRDMPLTNTVNDRDYVVTGMLTATYILFKDERFSVAALIGSNLWLNHLEVGLGWQL